MFSACDSVCSASGGAPSPSAPRMDTRFAITFGSVSMMIPPSTSSSIVSMTRSKFSSAVLFSTTPRRSRLTASKNAFRTIAMMSSFSSSHAVT
eukprot:31534-Pelagococcus_subviridis.AAC.6